MSETAEVMPLATMADLEKHKIVLEITGQVVASNLADFEAKASAVIAGIRTELVTDDHFAEAENNIKSCETVELHLAQAKLDIIQQSKSIADAIATIDRIDARFSEKRLVLKKLVVSEKEKRKNDIISEYRKRIDTLVAASPVAHGFTVDTQEFRNAVKGKRFVAKMEESCGAIVESMKERLSQLENSYAIAIATIEEKEKDFPGLFPDKRTLALKGIADVDVVIESRVLRFQQSIREKEEKAKAEVSAEAPQSSPAPRPPVPPAPGFPGATRPAPSVHGSNGGCDSPTPPAPPTPPNAGEARVKIGQPRTVGELRQMLSGVADNIPLAVINGPLPTLYVRPFQGVNYIEFD